MADSIKISELSELVSGSILDTTLVPVVDGGTTYHSKFSSVQAYMLDGVKGEYATSDSVLSIVDGYNISLNNFTASAQTSIDAINSITGSIQVSVDALNVHTGSISLTLNDVSSSYADTSASFSTRISASEASIDVIGYNYANKFTNNNFYGLNLFEGFTEFYETIFLTDIYPIGGYPSPNTKITINDLGTLSLYGEHINITGSVTCNSDLNVQGLINSPQYVDSETASLSPQLGSIIWNNTRLKLQVFTGSTWEDLH